VELSDSDSSNSAQAFAFSLSTISQPSYFSRAKWCETGSLSVKIGDSLPYWQRFGSTLAAPFECSQVDFLPISKLAALARPS